MIRSIKLRPLRSTGEVLTEFYVISIGKGHFINKTLGQLHLKEALAGIPIK